MKPNPGTHRLEPPEPPMLEWLREHGQVEAVFVSVRRRQQRQLRRRRVTAALLASFAVVFFALAWGLPFVRETETIATAAAHRRTLALRDGSRAELNAGTELFTDFRRGRRTMRLDRGEAFFVVAKDEKNPFVVKTPGGDIRVTGTEFNVRVAGSDVIVTLVEGSVEFERDGAASIGMKPQQQMRNGAVQELAVADLEDALAWRHGRAVFNGIQLAAAVERFAAYHGKAITVAPEIASLRLGGSYVLDNLPGFLAALEETLPVNAQAHEDGSYRIFAKPVPPSQG
jgi:transmembrane sensor